MLIVTHGLYGVGDNTPETEFKIIDPEVYDDGSVLAVNVHPWERTYMSGDPDRSVFISVGFENQDGSEWENPDGGEPKWNIIVDREEFVRGVLEVLPELKRA